VKDFPDVLRQNVFQLYIFLGFRIAFESKLRRDIVRFAISASGFTIGVFPYKGKNMNAVPHLVEA